MSFPSDMQQGSAEYGPKRNGRDRVRLSPTSLVDRADQEAQQNSPTLTNLLSHITPAVIVSAPPRLLTTSLQGLDAFAFTINWRAFTEQPPLRSVLDHARANPRDPLILKHAARIACRGEGYFGRFFLRWVEVEYIEWNSYRRMTLILRYLATCDDKLAAIAADCGFSVRTFERHCLDWTGVTPQELRDLLREALHIPAAQSGFWANRGF